MKTPYCFLKRFNNYFNRKIIKFDDVSDYENNCDEVYIPLDSEGNMTSFDFNPNDNVTTEIIVNSVPFEPDYFLLLDFDANILQRWFVLEQKRNRNGQWTYYLRRDVISDNLENLYDSPIFVEKGMLPEDDPFIFNSEGMNFNQVKKSETKLLDKSRTSWIVGYMAKNTSGTDISIQVDSEDVYIDYVNLADIASAMGTTEGVLAGLVNIGDDVSNKAYFATSISMIVNVVYSGLYNNAYTSYNYNFDTDFNSGTGTIGSSGSAKPFLFAGTLGENQNLFTDLFKEAVIYNKTLWQAQIDSILSLSYFLTQDQLEILRTYEGRTVRYNNKFYQLILSEEGTDSYSTRNIKKNGIYSAVDNTADKTVELASGILSIHTGTYNPSFPSAYVLDTVTANRKKVVISLIYYSDEQTIPQTNATISSGRNITADQEFDIFAIPLNIRVIGTGIDFNTLESYSRRIASAIGLEQDAKVYDLQLLPYCPLPDLVTVNNQIDITNLVEHEGYDFITKGTSNPIEATVNKEDMTFTPNGDAWDASFTLNMPDVPVGETPTVAVEIITGSYSDASNISYSYSSNVLTVSFTYEGVPPSDLYSLIQAKINYYWDETTNCGIIFYLNSSSFYTSVALTIESDKHRKIVNSCYMWRVVSPNYQGAFEFNIAKTYNKRIRYFNVFCTYKPFTPFIKVAPEFNFMYGEEFADNRGLICGGDFSLPRASDAWVSYQLNNKNYQNIFNREIQNLDFMQSIEMRNAIVSGAVSILSDSAKGALSGAVLGGGVGAIAGGVVAGTASAVGYGIDLDTLARTQRENKQLAIDKFNYQLGNIKALPYTLTKVGSFDIISKIFPFVEEYSATDKEIEALENKILYESMTVMRIGTLREFANFNSRLNYFKGQLIRNDLIADDTHVFNAIYEELLKGVYI